MMWAYQAPVGCMLHLMTRALDALASWAGLRSSDGLDAITAREVPALAALRLLPPQVQRQRAVRREAALPWLQP